MHRCLCEPKSSLSWDTWAEVQLLSHTVVTCLLLLKETAELSSFGHPTFLPTSSVRVIQFLCIFIHMWYCHSLFLAKARDPV